MISTISTLLMTLPLIQGQAVTPTLYTPGKSIKDQKIALQGWGNGTMSETDEMSFQSNRSIRVSTRNFFHGGRMTFAEHIKLSEIFDSKTSLVRIMFFVPDARLRIDRQGGIPTGSGGVMLLENPINELRLIFTTTDDKMSEIFLPIDTTFAVERGWRSAAFPLSAVRGFDRTNKIVKTIGVSANATVSMYLGDIRVVTDETPIKGELVGPKSMNLALGDEVLLRATGSAGASVLKYEWDFDSSDGIQADSEGQSVRRKFRKAGNYTVTVKISDYYGLKEPVLLTIAVKVNP
jgi:hypothetical protein